MKQLYFIGAHPDDLIGGAALLLHLSKNADYSLQVLDLTQGEYGCPGVAPDSAAQIRAAEEISACKMLNAEPVFLGEIDSFAHAGKTVCARLAKMFQAAAPDVIVTHWPVDTHVDHVMCYAAVRGAIREAGIKMPEIYGFEESIQTRMMPATHFFVFGEDLMQRKLDLIRCYTSQNHDDETARRKLVEARYHGCRCNACYAEPYAGMPAAPEAVAGILTAGEKF